MFHSFLPHRPGRQFESNCRLQLQNSLLYITCCCLTDEKMTTLQYSWRTNGLRQCFIQPLEESRASASEQSNKQLHHNKWLRLLAILSCVDRALRCKSLLKLELIKRMDRCNMSQTESTSLDCDRFIEPIRSEGWTLSCCAHRGGMNAQEWRQILKHKPANWLSGSPQWGATVWRTNMSLHLYVPPFMDKISICIVQRRLIPQSVTMIWDDTPGDNSGLYFSDSVCWKEGPEFIVALLICKGWGNFTFMIF